MIRKNKLTKNRLMKFAVQGIVLGILATTAVLFFTTDPDTTLTQIREFHWELGAACIGLVVLAWLSNGLRVFMLCYSMGHTLRYHQALCISLSSEFGIAATPAGVGGAAIRLSMLRYAGVPLAIGTTMLTVDVAVDALFFLFVLPFAIVSILNQDAIFKVLPWKSPEDFRFPLVLIFGILLFLLLLYRSGLVRKFLIWTAFSKPLRHFRLWTRIHWAKRRLNKEMRLMKEGYSHLFSVKRGVLVFIFFVAAVQWSCRYGVLSMLLFGFGLANNPFLLFFLQGILFSISLLVILPGGGGGVEVLTAIVLKQMYPDAPVGVVILLWRVLTYHFYLFVGGSTFLWSFGHLHRLFPQAPMDEPEPDIDILDIEDELDAELKESQT